jgi:hypothetical protein
MKNISTGAGLAILGLGVAAHPVLSNFGSSAVASASTAPAAAAVAAVASVQGGPTIVWMGVSSHPYGGAGTPGWTVYHRLWSDGRMEQRRLYWSTSCAWQVAPCDGGNWTEVPPPPGGNGFACRADINGDRKVDSADLGAVLSGLGELGGCEPEATYPCLNLGDLAGDAAIK